MSKPSLRKWASTAGRIVLSANHQCMAEDGRAARPTEKTPVLQMVLPPVMAAYSTSDCSWESMVQADRRAQRNGRGCYCMADAMVRSSPPW